MPRSVPALTTDQVAAFVELARHGSLRRASEVLHLSEQGLRNRLVALEARLQVELYRKARGIRQSSPLTRQGREFLPHALAFLEHVRELSQVFQPSSQPCDVYVAASQYLMRYVLIDATRRFHARYPRIRVRLSVHSEQEIESVLVSDSNLDLGVAAPYEPPAELHYDHLFAMNWSLITPPRHPLAKRPAIGLGALVNEPLILFERGSTGRQHVLEAFHLQGLTPRVHMETTTTEIVVRMVEAGLGIAIVPLLPSGVVTRHSKVAIRPLTDPIRPINSGVLTRRGDRQTAAAQEFIGFIRQGETTSRRGRK